MLVLKGQSLFAGIVIGPMTIYEPAATITSSYITNTENEVNRFQAARNSALEHLKTLYKTALISVGEQDAGIFETHQLMLEDLDFIEAIESLILEENLSAEAAVNIASAKFSRLFKEMDDAYMQARAEDIADISAKIISFLTGFETSLNAFPFPVILAAKELLPSEIIQLDKSKILGFITSAGSLNSHTAILARALGLPAIIAVDNFPSKTASNVTVILDGLEGYVYIEPDERTVNIMTQKKEEIESQQKTLDFLKGKKNITKSGKEIKLLANISSLKELQTALDNDAEGIGLLRSEFLYLNKNSFPTEEEQYLLYKTIIETMAGKPVIIRTLDIGSDKKASYFHLPLEENPALGYRAIRICLREPHIFKVQLRAILRAAVFGNAAIMFPMVNSVEEILAVKAIVQEVKNDLKKENLQFSEAIKLGTMIETPAAAIISDDLAREVDFFSIGTNDLTQYTLAIDRQNENLSNFFDPHHKAVLKLIELTIKNAHKAKIPVGICGELGADKKLTSLFINLGVDELSVSPTYILPLRKTIRNLE